MITPFRESQEQARDIIEAEGEFVLVYVKCSVEAAEQRDPKGLYEQAREEKIEKFTGISHPFQEPLNPDIVVDTETESIEDGVSDVLAELRDRGLLNEEPDEEYTFSMSRKREEAIVDRLADLGYLNE
jgi:adenylylsulfate kinase